MESPRKVPARIEVMDEQMAAIYRAMPGHQKLRIASDMYSRARKMLLRYLRTEHPEWSEEQVVKETARRLSHGAV